MDINVVATLKTRKDLEKIGYTYNKKSLFAPLTIDLEKDNARASRNDTRVIRMAVFKKLGKEIFIKDLIMVEGVECFTIEIIDHKFTIPCILVKDLTPKEFLNIKKKIDQKNKQEQKTSTIMIKDHNGNLISFNFNIHHKKMTLGYNQYKLSELKKIAKFILKQK